jgi:hypothetical protein
VFSLCTVLCHFPVPQLNLRWDSSSMSSLWLAHDPVQGSLYCLTSGENC